MTAQGAGEGFPWWVLLLQGIAAVVLGVLLFARPGVTTLILVQFVGWYWLVTGIFGLATLFVDKTLWGWRLFGGLLGVLAGGMVISRPLWSTVVVATVYIIILGINGLLIGTVDIVNAFRGAGWGTGAFGVLSIVLSVWLLSNAPEAAIALPWVVGVLAVAFGLFGIVAAFQLRGAQAGGPATA